MKKTQLIHPLDLEDITDEDNGSRRSKAVSFAEHSSRSSSGYSLGSSSAGRSSGTDIELAWNYTTKEVDEELEVKKDMWRNYFLRWLPKDLEVEFWMEESRMIIFRLYWIYYFFTQVSFIGFANPSWIGYEYKVVFGLLCILGCIIFYFSWDPKQNVEIYFKLLWLHLGTWVILTGYCYSRTSHQTLWESYFLQLFSTMIILGIIPCSYFIFGLPFFFIFLGIFTFVTGHSLTSLIINMFVCLGLFYISAIQILRDSCLTRKQEFLYSRKLTASQHQLESQIEMSENLLSNILPHSVSEKLKRKRVLDKLDSLDGVLVSEHFRSVTILFADIVGFTDLSSRYSPEAIVTVLNEIFSSFDQLCVKFRVEKLKTIGDAYVAVCGLPTPDENHAKNVIEMALAMLEVPDLSNNLLNEVLKIRIGIASGSVTAGVIGAHRWTYDVYGPSIHQAEMEEASAPANGIRINSSTLRALKDTSDYRVQPVQGAPESFIITRDSPKHFPTVEMNTPTTNSYNVAAESKPLGKTTSFSSLDAQFNIESQLNPWTINFKNKEVNEGYWSWRKLTLHKQIKPHLLVGVIILIAFFIEDLMDSSPKSIIVTAIAYPIGILASLITFFLQSWYIKTELRTNITSLVYFCIYILVCLTTLATPTPEKILNRTEVYMLWISCAPKLGFWSLIGATMLQYCGGIAYFFLFKVTSESLPLSLSSPIFARVAIQLWWGKYMLVKNEKRKFITFKSTELKRLAVKREEERSRRLLLNILPEHIISELKTEGVNHISKSYPEVSCMFVRLQGVETQSPTEITSLLNGVFALWDKYTQSLHLEKIKTIGFAYMVVGGTNNNSRHLIHMTQLALLMKASVRELSERYATTLDVSIGISLGPCVGGVIGKKKFCYDLWGDTINQASRMESNGEKGHIHVTKEVARELNTYFLLESRGNVFIKGKGEIETFWLFPRGESPHHTIS
eukprot:TRINITY_DN3723_c0_g1_i1.p1 TRINITY_DN3723_c0_g1~~TRINITY_DN3723_c0_g1_i1.p1  ORF type:complete len:960 (+),score=190.55 TRINITY_DN3723_c0_g1_i1:23-2902(+)